MKVQVEPCAGPLGLEMPTRFRFGRREIEIVETVDQWDGSDHYYFKIKDNDGNLYILRFEQSHAEWELTMFQSRGAHSTPPEGKQILTTSQQQENFGGPSGAIVGTSAS
jgi:hypothetical protein